MPIHSRGHGRRDQSVTIEQLSVASHIRIDQLRALADAGYLRISKKGLSPRTTRVERIGDLASWPYIRLSTIARRPPKTSVAELRRICRLYEIPIMKDWALGEVMTATGVHRLLTCQRSIRDPRVVDRVSMLIWLTGMDSVDPRRSPEFSLVMEREAKRVAKLPEPARTDAALLLLGRYRDAVEIADALHRGDIRLRAERVAKGDKFRERLEKAAGIR